MELWASRTNSVSSSSTVGGFSVTKAEGSHESPRQPPDSPVPGGDVRQKVHSQLEEGDAGGSGGDGVKVEGGVKKKGVLEGGFLGRKRAPPVPHFSLPSGSEGGGSDSSANASPSPTKLAASTSPRQKKLAAEASSQDSSL